MTDIRPAHHDGRPESSIGSRGCPKDMVFGPCGGVASDGTCELGDRPCSFLDQPLPQWSAGAEQVGSATVGSQILELLARRPIVVADMPARPMDAGSLAACAGELVGAVDAVLLGDAPGARVQLSPTLRAQIVMGRGLRAWSGLNCRDRNRVALEGELASLAAIGAAAVHCVTGDHPLGGHRADAKPVFDLDSLRLAALARTHGHLVSVAEAPAAPPRSQRPERLAEKVAAGAQLAFVNHCGPADEVARFARRVADLGAGVPLIACVPVVVDKASAELLRSFSSLVLPTGFLDRILAAVDPFAEGVAAAAALAADLLAVDGVCGIDLSGGPGVGAEQAFAAALAAVAARIS